MDVKQRKIPHCTKGKIEPQHHIYAYTWGGSRGVQGSQTNLVELVKILINALKVAL